VGVTPIFEEPLMEELDIYEEEGVETLMDEEGISGAECGFMAGFLAS
jgi:hypothetical protein